MILEWVKWRGAERTSQMPSSGRIQASVRCLSSERCSPQAMSWRARPALARLVERVHQLAVHVELQLRRGGVADAHRR
jgi:hypothetical protein